MRIDVLVAEIGSTTTLVNGFIGINSASPQFIGQGQAPTTVLDGDVLLGLRSAVESLRKIIKADTLEYDEMFATSSAAGGLRMTVHGLVYDMTVRAAKEAALGAGAIIKMTTAGVLTEYDLEEIEQIRPNLILLAGGTDYGERQTALENAALLCGLNFRPPVIYAGNVQNQSLIKGTLELAGFRCYVAENVYPRLDDLNIEPTRKIIHQVFEEHITNAPGMQDVKEMVTGPIIPTPGAVMECARLLYQDIGDLITVDVGGATTDVHSITDGSEEIAMMQIAPEPKAKRTVEGDLGVYVNAKNLAESIGIDHLSEECKMDVSEVLKTYLPIPKTEDQYKLTTSLAWHAAAAAIQRHAGNIRYTYGASGRKAWAEGKDLTKVKWLVATGGALTRLPERGSILSRLCEMNKGGTMLYPRPGQMWTLEDQRYIMASLGVLSKKYPAAASVLIAEDMELKEY